MTSRNKKQTAAGTRMIGRGVAEEWEETWVENDLNRGIVISYEGRDRMRQGG